MKNFETSTEVIREAFNKGLITNSDYNAWLSAQGYRTALKKSLDAGVLSQQQFAAEDAKASAMHFQRDFESPYTLRFKLYGGNFQPLDLSSKSSLIKSQQQNLLDTWVTPQPVRKRLKPLELPHLKKMESLAEDFRRMASETKVVL